MERLSAPERTREELRALMNGELGTAAGRSDLVRLALRLIVEEALEGEVADVLGRERYERGDGEKAGYRNGYRPGKVKTAEGAVEFGAEIHPQYLSEFENGVAVAWSRVPFTLGCAGDWSDDARKAHYDDLCAIDGRIVLAGEHASYIPAWQEGAILSALDAIARLHKRVVAT